MRFLGVALQIRPEFATAARLTSRTSEFLKKANLGRSQEIAATKTGLARPKCAAPVNSQLFTSFHSCLTPTLFRRTMFVPG
jgi:hypothetical protein